MTPRPERHDDPNAESLVTTTSSTIAAAATVELPRPRDRSVVDYESVAELTQALQASSSFSSSSLSSSSFLTEERDWELTKYNVKTTVKDPNNIPNEVDRLLCLKSYHILDTAHDEPEFEFITQEAQKVFDCPIAIISLVDLGRQWFKSIQGLPPSVKETPRCMAFCSHVIQQKKRRQVLVVPDATQDVRFQHNPLVTGDPHIRFYAGTALWTPEGQRVGTLCIIDTQPHPEGLDDHEQRLLQTMAQEVVLQMILRTEEGDE
jgi:hypothetical protein